MTLMSLRSLTTFSRIGDDARQGEIRGEQGADCREVTVEMNLKLGGGSGVDTDITGDKGVGGDGALDGMSYSADGVIGSAPTHFYRKRHYRVVILARMD